MTPDPEQIAREYLRREHAACKTVQGQDPNEIIEELAKEHDLEPDVVAEIVLSHTFAGPM